MPTFSPDPRFRAPALVLVLGAAVACNANPSDKGGSGTTMMQETTGTGDTDGDGDATDTDGESTDGETTDGDPDICNGNVPAFVTPECVADLWLFIQGLAAQSRGGDVDVLCDAIDQAIKQVAQHSSDSVGPDELQIPWLIIKALLFETLTASGDAGSTGERAAPNLDPRTIDEEFPCGDGPRGYTICASQNAFPAGETIVLAAITEEEIPLMDGEWLKELSFVFDADGDPNNNYVAAPAYPNDFFQDTDRWYVARWDGASWVLAVSTAIDSNIQAAASDARVVIAGNTVMALIPASEFTTACPDWRVTTFAHKGDYGINPPHDWSGALEPPVDMGLNTCG